MTLTQNYPQLKKIPHWLTAFFVVLLAITLAQLLWMVSTPKDKSVAQVTSPQSNTVLKRKQQPNYGKIIARQHLFGLLEKKPVVVAPPPTKVAVNKKPAVVVPKLNVKLFGIMSYSNQSSGYVLLSYNRKPQAVYAINEALDENDKEKKVFIKSISAEKVVISNHGNLEEFSLPKPAGSKSKNTVAIAANASVNNPAPSASAAVRSRARAPNDFMLGQPVASATSPHPSKAVKAKKTDSFSLKNMSEFRNKVMADPSKLMEIASAAPYSKNGQIVGFRVRAGKNRRAFRQLGLRNGDIVKEVNGIALDSTEKGIMLMSDLAGASELSITVLRGKREVQLPTLHF